MSTCTSRLVEIILGVCVGYGVEVGYCLILGDSVDSAHARTNSSAAARDRINALIMGRL